MSASSAIRWRALDRREGDIAPRRQGGDRTSHRIEAHADQILSALVEKSDITLAELRDKLKEHGVRVGIGTLWRFFKRSQDDAQKKTVHAAEQRRCAVNASREAWFEGQLDLDPTRIVFIDETAANTKDGAPLRPCAQGRALPRLPCLTAIGNPT